MLYVLRVGNEFIDKYREYPNVYRVKKDMYTHAESDAKAMANFIRMFKKEERISGAIKPFGCCLEIVG